jgi:hypothetical protein
MFATLSDMFSGRKSWGGEAIRDESDSRGDHGQSSPFENEFADVNFGCAAVRRLMYGAERLSLSVLNREP